MDSDISVGGDNASFSECLTKSSGGGAAPMYIQKYLGLLLPQDPGNFGTKELKYLLLKLNYAELKVPIKA